MRIHYTSVFETEKEMQEAIANLFDSGWALTYSGEENGWFVIQYCLNGVE